MVPSLIYQLIKRSRKPATIIKRHQTIERLTGHVSVTEETWSGYVGFVENSRMPQQDIIVVADAWIVTEQQIDDKMIVCCQGKSYSVLKIADHGKYRVVAMKAAAKESYRDFRADMTFISTFNLLQELYDELEFIDEMSGILE